MPNNGTIPHTSTYTGSSSFSTTTKVVSGSIPSTITRTATITTPTTTQTHTSHRPTTTVGLAPDGGATTSSGGLSTGQTIAIAVVIPIVAVALLILLGIFCWRRRKQRKIAEEARRKEVEEYGYNPNDDPTLPAVAGFGGEHSPEMSEDTSGYRGWGNTLNGGLSARKTSTNLSSGMGGGMTSDDGRGRSPGSPNQFSDRPGDAALVGGAAAAATGAAVATGIAHRTSNGGANGNNLERGPSNASSTYSAAGRTDESGDILGNYDTNYSQLGYNPGATGFADGGQPVIRDVNARRNTKIENAVYPQQGNSGIAQNF